MSYKPAIQVNNLNKYYQIYAQPVDRLKQFLWRNKRTYYKEFKALQDVNFDIMPGEVIGIMGRNGSGKSTLLQLICGTLTPTSGNVSVHGRIAALLELGAGFNPEFSGRENVWMSAAISGLKQQEIANKFDDIVEFSGIADFIDQPVKTYSSGMYVRLAFSVAINVDPDILVIDEALSVGDGAFARKSFDRIMNLKKEGKTILFCSHSIYQIEAICDRAIWLDKGLISMIGTASDVANKYSQSLISVTDETKNNHSPDISKSVAAKGTARITKVQGYVDGIKGTSLQVKSQQSTIKVLVQFDFDPELPTPHIVIAFSTADGLGISSMSSYHDKIDLNKILGKNNEVEITFPAIPLLKGDYLISIYLSCENAAHCYDMALNIISIKVEQDGTEQGFMMLPHQWGALS